MSTDVGTIIGYLALDGTQFDESIARAIAELEVLSGKDVKIKVDVSQMSEVKAKAEEAVSGLDHVERKSSETDSAFRSNVSGMVAAIAMLGPALVPMAAGTAALGIGFAGMATAGILAFKGIQYQMSQGTHAGDVFRSGIDVLTTSFHTLASVAATHILGDFQNTVDVLVARTPALAGQIGNLATEAGKAGSNIATGLLNIFQKLGPSMQGVGAYIVTLTGEFTRMTQGSGLSQFADYIVGLMPRVVNFLTQVITVVGRLLIALTPFGTTVLNILTIFVTALNSIPLPMLTQLANLAASVFAGFKAWEALTGIIEGVVETMKALNDVMEVTEGTMRALQVASGIVGIAIAAITLVMANLSEKSNEAKQAEEELTRAFQESNGAIDENIRTMEAKALQDQGVFDAASQLGLSLKDVTDAALGQSDAMARVNAHMSLVGKSMANAGLDATNLVGDTTDVQGAMDKVRGAIKGTNEELKAGHDKWQQIHNATTATVPVLTAAQAAEMGVASALHTNVTALDAAKAAQQKQAKAAEDATLKMQIEGDAAGLLKQALDKLNGKAISAAEAQNQFESSLIGMTKAAKNSKNAADGAGKSIGGMSQQSVNARSALLQQTRAAWTSAQANGDLSGSNLHARDTLIALRQKIIDNAVAHGYNRQQVQRYIDTVFKIPKNASTLMTVKDAAALAQIQHFSAMLSSINGRVAVTTIRNVTDNIVNSYNGVGGASGHGMLRKNFYGGIQSFRDGGIMQSFANGGTLPTSATIAPDGANLVQWAESGTGGEAFIPLGSYNRDRSIQVWEETGRRLGVSGNSRVVVYVQSPIDSSYIKATVAAQAEEVYKAQAAAAQAQAQVATRALAGAQAKLAAETKLANNYRTAEEMWKARALSR